MIRENVTEELGCFKRSFLWVLPKRKKQAQSYNLIHINSLTLGMLQVIDPDSCRWEGLSEDHFNSLYQMSKVVKESSHDSYLNIVKSISILFSPRTTQKVSDNRYPQVSRPILYLLQKFKCFHNEPTYICQNLWLCSHCPCLSELEPRPSLTRGKSSCAIGLATMSQPWDICEGHLCGCELHLPAYFLFMKGNEELPTCLRQVTIFVLLLRNCNFGNFKYERFILSIFFRIL